MKRTSSWMTLNVLTYAAPPSNPSYTTTHISSKMCDIKRLRASKYRTVAFSTYNLTIVETFEKNTLNYMKHEPALKQVAVVLLLAALWRQMKNEKRTHPLGTVPDTIDTDFAGQCWIHENNRILVVLAEVCQQRIMNITRKKSAWVKKSAWA